MDNVASLDKSTVKKVRQALLDADEAADFFDLPSNRPSAEPGAFVKSHVYTVGNRYVLALVAGDRSCRQDQLPRVFYLTGEVISPSADLVRAVTGFSQGEVPPVGLVTKLPIVLDASLKRFETLYVKAGDSQCVFAITMDTLKRLTGGLVSYAVAESK